MRNQNPGICYRCNKEVKIGGGHFERHKGGWRVQHAGCAIKYRGEETFKIRCSPILFKKIKSLTNDAIIYGIVQNDMEITVLQIKEWKIVAKGKIPDDLIEEVLAYLRSEWKKN